MRPGRRLLVVEEEEEEEQEEEVWLWWYVEVADCFDGPHEAWGCVIY